MVVQRFARFRTNLGNLRISQDICYVWMTDINDSLTKYGHPGCLLSNNKKYLTLNIDNSRVFLQDLIFRGSRFMEPLISWIF